MIAATMQKMSADHGLSAMQFVRFNSSPETYPVFRLRFHQIVDSKALAKPTKMARLLQFLEGPAIRAVPEIRVSSRGGLAKALQVLQYRFGQPFKKVRACVDNVTKGPSVAPHDKEGLQPNQMKDEPRSCDRNLCNCVKKPAKKNNK